MAQALGPILLKTNATQTMASSKLTAHRHVWHSFCSITLKGRNQLCFVNTEFCNQLFLLGFLLDGYSNTVKPTTGPVKNRTVWTGHSLSRAVDYFDAGAASTRIFAGLPVHLQHCHWPDHYYDRHQ
jgi:hypothetical protein